MGSLFLALHRSDRGSLPPSSSLNSSPSYLQSAMKHYDAAMMLGAYDRDVRAFYASQGTSTDSLVSEESPVAPIDAVAPPDTAAATDAATKTKTYGAGGIQPSVATNPALPTTFRTRTSRWVIKPDPDPPSSEVSNQHTIMGESIDMKMGGSMDKKLSGSMDMKMGGSMDSLLRSVEESMQPMQTASTAFEQMMRQQEALQQE